MSLPGRRWGRFPGGDAGAGGRTSGRPRPGARPRAGSAALAAVTLAVLASGPAGAQLPLPGGSTSTTAPPTTTTTSPPEPDPPPTSAPPATSPPPAPPAAEPAPAGAEPPAPEPGGAPASAAGGDRAAPSAPPDAAGQPAGPPAAAGAPGGPAPGGPGQPAGPVATGGGTGAPVVAPGEVPAAARLAMSAVRRSGPNSTRKLLAALAPLRELGMSEQEVIAAGFGRFPVGGVVTFSHDWLYPRHTPTFHLHQGTDLFAATGTPVRSPADGTLKLSQGGAGGLAVYVYQSDGTYFYMAHLSAFVPGQRPGQQVKVGEVVGYVGDSGNAKGGSPHVHFEIHPAPSRAVVSGKGRSRTVTHVPRPVPVGTVLPAMDPKATLDLWLLDALAAAPQLVADVERRARPEAAARSAAGDADAVKAAGLVAASTARTELLWVSSVSPSSGAVRLAEVEALRAARELDWTRTARRQEALLAEQAAAVAWTEAVLAALTPDSLLGGTSPDE